MKTKRAKDREEIEKNLRTILRKAKEFDWNTTDIILNVEQILRESKEKINFEF